MSKEKNITILHPDKLVAVHSDGGDIPTAPLPMIPYPFDPIMDIRNFHEKFGLAYSGGPRDLEPEIQQLRMDMIQEETTELYSANTKADNLDACVDLIYFILGYCYLRGWNFQEAWKRVHEANMAKERAKSPDESKRGSSFDVIKPPGWTAPDLSDLVGEEPEPAINWDEAITKFNNLMASQIIKDRPPHQYSSLGAFIRLRFKPILEKIEHGERSKSLYQEMGIVQGECL